MPRSGRLRNFIKEIAESPLTEKISFTPPFLILAIEILLLQHAVAINVPYVIELTTVLLVISAIEILLVSQEIHDHYKRNSFYKTLTIKLDDFILQNKKENVKRIVEDFIVLNPKYRKYRNEIYHTSCQIMETHKEEILEKDLMDKLEMFIKREKRTDVGGILEGFMRKYPHYRKHRDIIYQKTCEILEKSRDNP